MSFKSQQKYLDVRIRWIDDLGKVKLFPFKLQDFNFLKLDELGKKKYKQETVYYWRKSDQKPIKGEEDMAIILDEISWFGTKEAINISASIQNCINPKLSQSRGRKKGQNSQKWSVKSPNSQDKMSVYSRQMEREEEKRPLQDKQKDKQAPKAKSEDLFSQSLIQNDPKAVSNKQFSVPKQQQRNHEKQPMKSQQQTKQSQQVVSQSSLVKISQLEKSRQDVALRANNIFQAELSNIHRTRAEGQQINMTYGTLGSNFSSYHQKKLKEIEQLDTKDSIKIADVNVDCIQCKQPYSSGPLYQCLICQKDVYICCICEAKDFLSQHPYQYHLLAKIKNKYQIITEKSVRVVACKDIEPPNIKEFQQRTNSKQVHSYQKFIHQENNLIQQSDSQDVSDKDKLQQKVTQKKDLKSLIQIKEQSEQKKKSLKKEIKKEKKKDENSSKLGEKKKEILEQKVTKLTNDQLSLKKKRLQKVVPDQTQRKLYFQGQFEGMTYAQVLEKIKQIRGQGQK